LPSSISLSSNPAYHKGGAVLASMITNELETYLKCPNMNAARLEDLNFWKMEKEYVSVKGVKRHEYSDGLVATWFEGL
jgi:hypothetical protein